MPAGRLLRSLWARNAILPAARGFVVGAVLVGLLCWLSVWQIIVNRAPDINCPRGSSEHNRPSPVAATTPLTRAAKKRNNDLVSLARDVEEGRRILLPERIIMLRHGESEGNVDKTVYQRKPDNLLELTDVGIGQAEEAGRRIKEIIGEDPLIIFVSPFLRAFQTLQGLRRALDDNIERTEVEPSLREQEFGNIQPKDFAHYRLEQNTVGRFWYRFPTGESGADVYQRVTVFWDKLKQVNVNPQMPPVNTVLVVTHGLAMRMLLMRLFSWSPSTFESVYNAENCEMWALRKNLSKAGDLPYELDNEIGSTPRSSRAVHVIFKNGTQRKLILEDYLSLEPPRTSQKSEAIKMLVKQHDLDWSTIEDIDFFADPRFGKYQG